MEPIYCNISAHHVALLAFVRGIMPERPSVGVSACRRFVIGMSNI